MMRMSSKAGNTFLIRKFLFGFIISLVIINAVNLGNFDTITPVSAATKEEAFNSIISAFEKIEQASIDGIDVQSYIDDLNDALEKYHAGLYDEAYTIAETVTEEVTDIISKVQWDKVSAYVIVPINIVLVAAIVVFFGRNILGWFRRRRDEEYLDLEIVYETATPEEGRGKTATEEGGSL